MSGYCARRGRLALLLVSALLNAACVTKEGIAIPLPFSSGPQESYPESVIMIGNTSAYRSIKPEKVEKHYKSYAKNIAKVRPEESPGMTLDQFRQSIAGWTLIKGFHIPLVMSRYCGAYVPKSLTDVNYSGLFETFMFQASSDLVAARAGPDGVFVIEKLLCPDTRAGRECKKKFKKGTYDATTGYVLGRKLQPNTKGARIDTATYEYLKD